MSIYGELRTAVHAEEAVKDTLVAWLPTYLAEVERQHDIEPGHIARLQSLVTTRDLDHRRPEDHLPAGLVMAGASEGDPYEDADGNITLIYPVGVAIVLTDVDEQSARSVGLHYNAAVRGAIMQNKSLNGQARIKKYAGEDFARTDPEESRTLFVAINEFEVEVRGVVNTKAGLPPTWDESGPTPAEPPVDPLADPPEPPTTNSVDIDVGREV